MYLNRVNDIISINCITATLIQYNQQCTYHMLNLLDIIIHIFWTIDKMQLNIKAILQHYSSNDNAGLRNDQLNASWKSWVMNKPFSVWQNYPLTLYASLLKTSADYLQLSLASSGQFCWTRWLSVSAPMEGHRSWPQSTVDFLYHPPLPLALYLLHSSLHYQHSLSRRSATCTRNSNTKLNR